MRLILCQKGACWVKSDGSHVDSECSCDCHFSVKSKIDFHLPWRVGQTEEKNGLLIYTIENARAETIVCTKKREEAHFIVNCVNASLKSKLYWDASARHPTIWPPPESSMAKR